jgi:hypothetical protein
VGGVQCRTAFPGNKIGSTLDPVAQKVLGFLTATPNVPASAGNRNGLINNFVFASTKPIRDTTMSFRIDQNWGSKNKFFFSYASRDQEVLNGTPQIPGPLDPNFFNSNFTHYLRTGWDYTISPNLLNTLTVGLNRLNNFSKGVSVNGTPNWDSVLGITGASGPVFPQFSFNGVYQGLSTGNDDGHIPNSLVTAENVAWITGRHSFNFGFEWRSYQYSALPLGNSSPAYTFKNLETAFAPNDNTTGDPFASFLLGLPDQERLTVSSVLPLEFQLLRRVRSGRRESSQGPDVQSGLAVGR